MLFDGELDVIRGYLKSNESQLGRSLVVNLDADIKNNIRMVDQRTITFIIIRNIKYYLKTGKSPTNQVEMPNPYVDVNKLRPNDIVSITQYLKVNKVSNGIVSLIGGDDLDWTIDIMHRDAYSASLFEKEQKATMTEVSNILSNALTTCFTVCFHTKPDKKTIITNI